MSESVFESAARRFPLGVRKPIAHFLMGITDIVLPEAKAASMIDEETGLLTKKSFRNEFYRRVQHDNAGKKYLVFFDGDGFGAINKEHGHLIGDDVIVDFARRIQGGMRSSDLIGRYGGDEFIAYCDAIPDHQTLYRRLEQINNSLCGDYSGILSLSIGAAEVVDGSFSRTVALADKLQREVKQRGGNGVRIYGYAPDATLPMSSRG